MVVFRMIFIVKRKERAFWTNRTSVCLQKGSYFLKVQLESSSLVEYFLRAFHLRFADKVIQGLIGLWTQRIKILPYLDVINPLLSNALKFGCFKITIMKIFALCMKVKLRAFFCRKLLLRIMEVLTKSSKILKSKHSSLRLNRYKCRNVYAHSNGNKFRLYEHRWPGLTTAFIGFVSLLYNQRQNACCLSGNWTPIRSPTGLSNMEHFENVAVLFIS